METTIRLKGASGQMSCHWKLDTSLQKEWAGGAASNRWFLIFGQMGTCQDYGSHLAGMGSDPLQLVDLSTVAHNLGMYPHVLRSRSMHAPTVASAGWSRPVQALRGPGI